MIEKNKISKFHLVYEERKKYIDWSHCIVATSEMRPAFRLSQTNSVYMSTVLVRL